jgi:hypothetical protein
VNTRPHIAAIPFAALATAAVPDAATQLRLRTACPTAAFADS